MAVHELVADGPELGRVHGPRRAVALVVVLPVAAALARPEPRRRGHAVGVLAAGRFQHGGGDRTPLGALHRPVHPPVVGLEPALRGPGHDRRDGRVVDPVVVPVEQEHEVRQAQAPGRVAGLVAGARGQATLALDHEDLDLLRAGQLERDRLAQPAAAGRGPTGRCSTSGTGSCPPSRRGPGGRRGGGAGACPPSPGPSGRRRGARSADPGRARHGRAASRSGRPGWRRRAARCGPPRARTDRRTAATAGECPSAWRPTA